MDNISLVSENVDTIKCNETSDESDPETQIDLSIRWYKLIFELILMIIVFIVGMFGNILSFLALLKAQKTSPTPSSTIFILICLSLDDCIVLCSSICFRVIGNLQIITGWYPEILQDYYPFFLPIIYYVGHSFRMLRNWTIVMVSAERWIAITWPLKAQIICNIEKARAAIIFLLLMSIVFNIPRIFQALPSYQNICSNGIFTEIVITVEYPFSNLFKILYFVAGYFLIIIAGPFVILTILNVLLIRGICKASKERESLIFPQGKLKSSTMHNDISKHHHNSPEFLEESFSQSGPSNQSGKSRKYLSCGKSTKMELEKFEVSNPGGSDSAGKCSSGFQHKVANHPLKFSNKGKISTRPTKLSVRSAFDEQSSIRSDPLPNKKIPITKTRTEITRICIGIVMVYIICEFPALVHTFLLYWWNIPYIIRAYINPVSNLLVALNSTLNFLIYVLLGSRFRSLFIQTLNCRKEQKPSCPSSYRMTPTPTSGPQFVLRRCRTLEAEIVDESIENPNWRRTATTSSGTKFNIFAK